MIAQALAGRVKTRLFSGQIDAPAGATTPTGEAPFTLDRPVRIVYEGVFNSMDGEVTLTAEDIDAIAANHNAKLAKLTVAGTELTARDYPPMQLDHSESATATIGRLWGSLESKDALVNGERKRALFGNARFIGQENTQKAADGRYTHVSIGFDPTTNELDEISVVPFPAAPNAALLSRGRLAMKPEHLKAYLTSAKGMSEDDALRHLGGLDDDGKTKLGEEMKDHLAKMGAEVPEDKEQGKLAAEDDEEKKKLAAEEEEKKKLAEEDEKEKLARAAEDDEKDEGKKLARGKKTKLAAQLKDAHEKLRLARLEVKKGEVKARLSGLRGQAKITPAEEKNLEAKRFGTKKLALHELDDIALEAVLGVMEAREPVLDVRRLGSAKGVDLANMGAAMKKARLAAQESETLSNMPFTKLALANTRAAEGGGDARLGSGEDNVVRLSPSEQLHQQEETQTESDEQSRQESEARLASSKVLGDQIASLTTLVTAIEQSL